MTIDLNAARTAIRQRALEGLVKRGLTEEQAAQTWETRIDPKVDLQYDGQPSTRFAGFPMSGDAGLERLLNEVAGRPLPAETVEEIAARQKKSGEYGF